MTSTYVLQSVVRAIGVLETVAQAPEPITPAAIAQTLGIERATVYRICRTLRDLGYLEIEHGKVQPGMRGVLLGRAALRGRDLTQLAMGPLEELQKRRSLTTNLVHLVGHEIFYVLRYKSNDILGTNLPVGSRLPTYCTSAGRAILAFLPKEEQREVLSRQQLRRLTECTMVDPVELEKELEITRERGYAIVDQEMASGLRGVGAPILLNGNPTAAISASQVGGLSREELETIVAPEVVNIARALSSAISVPLDLM